MAAERVAADYRVCGRNPNKDPMEHASICQSNKYQLIDHANGREEQMETKSSSLHNI